MASQDHQADWYCSVPDALRSSIHHLRELLEQPGVQWYQSDSGNEVLLERLFDLLIRPIQGLLDEIAPSPDQLVVFIPHAELTRVPFAALRDRHRPWSPWLIEWHTFAVAPSIRVLNHCYWRNWKMDHCNRPSLADSLVVGNPSPMPFHNGQLPAAEKEARSLASKLGCALVCVKPTCNQLHNSTLCHCTLACLVTGGLTSLSVVYRTCRF